MGMYSATFAAAMVVLQTTIMLLRRSNTQWSFNTVQRQAVWPASPDNITGAFLVPPPRPSFQSVVMPMLAPAPADSQLAWCLQAAWAAGTTSADVCWQRTHTPQQQVVVLAAWNPHLIVLALCCVHLVMCVGGNKHDNNNNNSGGGGADVGGGAASEAESGGGGSSAASAGSLSSASWGMGQATKIQLPGVIAVLAVVTLVVAIVCSLGASDQLRYPTILVVIALFLCASWYAFVLRRNGVSAHGWTIACHLQFVGVPLAVTMIAAMGVREWTDLLAHSILLSAAVNTLWLQHNLTTPAAVQVARLLTVGLPVHCAVVLNKQWSTNQWQQVATVMAGTALLPLLVLTVIHGASGWGTAPAAVATDDWLKTEQKAAHLCIAAALLASVANLSML